MSPSNKGTTMETDYKDAIENIEYEALILDMYTEEELDEAIGLESLEEIEGMLEELRNAVTAKFGFRNPRL